MRIYISEDSGKSIRLEFPGKETLEFESTKSLKSPKNAKQNEFDYLNRYWDSLRDEDREEMYELYRQIHVSIEDFRFVDDAMDYIRDRLTVLVDKFHHPDDIAEFLESQGLDYGSNIKEDIEEYHPDMPPQTTYTRHEYFGLACLTISFKAIFPIWHLWVKYNPGNRDNENNKNYQILDLFSLLKDSTIVETPEFEKLRTYCEYTYINQTTGGNKKPEINMYPAIEGCGTVQFPLYLMGRVLMEKLAKAHINDPDENVTLISAAHRKIITDLKSIGVTQRRLKPRSIDYGRGDYDDDKVNYFEAHSTHEAVDASVSKIHQLGLYDYRTLKRVLDNDIPTPLVKMCVESFEQFDDFELGNRIILIMWVMYKNLQGSSSNVHYSMENGVIRKDEEIRDILLAEALNGIDRIAVKHALAITQAALIFWNKRSLAALLSSQQVELRNSYGNSILPVDPGMKIKLLELNPYFRPNAKSSGSSKPVNLSAGVVAIEEFVSYYLEDGLELKCTPELAKELRMEPGYYEVPSTLRNDLAELFCFLNKNC